MEWLLTRIAGSISNGDYATEGYKVFASVPRLPAELVAGRQSPQKRPDVPI
jgi:hypothetical protein